MPKARAAQPRNQLHPTFQRQFNANHYRQPSFDALKLEFQQKQPVKFCIPQHIYPTNLNKDCFSCFSNGLNRLQKVLVKFQDMQDSLMRLKKQQVTELLSKISNCNCQRTIYACKPKMEASSLTPSNLTIKTPIKVGTKIGYMSAWKHKMEIKQTVKDKKKGGKKQVQQNLRFFRDISSMKMKSMLSSIDFQEESFEQGEREAFRELFSN